jgi:hypothetical protein
LSSTTAAEDDEVDAIMNRLDFLHDESHVRQYRPAEWGAMLRDAGFAVESMEPFSSLRSIALLKRGVTASNAAEIDLVMAGLSERQKSVMQVAYRDGELHHLHFYVMIAATKPDTKVLCAPPTCP